MLMVIECLIILIIEELKLRENFQDQYLVKELMM